MEKIIFFLALVSPTCSAQDPIQKDTSTDHKDSPELTRAKEWLGQTHEKEKDAKTSSELARKKSYEARQHFEGASKIEEDHRALRMSAQKKEDDSKKQTEIAKKNAEIAHRKMREKNAEFESATSKREAAQANVDQIRHVETEMMYKKQAENARQKAMEAQKKKKIAEEKADASKKIAGLARSESADVIKKKSRTAKMHAAS